MTGGVPFTYIKLFFMGKIPLYDTTHTTQRVEVHHRFEAFRKSRSTYVETGFSYGEGETMGSEDLLKGKYLSSFYNCAVRGVVELGVLSSPKIDKYQDLTVEEKEYRGYDSYCKITKLETVSEDVTEYMEVSNVLSYVQVGIGRYSTGLLSNRDTRKVRCVSGDGYRNIKITVETFLDKVCTKDDFLDNREEVCDLPFAVEYDISREEEARLEEKYTPLAEGLKKFRYSYTYEDKAVELGHTLYVKPEKVGEIPTKQAPTANTPEIKSGGMSLGDIFKDIKL